MSTPPPLLLANAALAGTLAGVAFFLVGAAIVWLGRMYLARDRAIARWPRAPGTIVSSTYKTHESTRRVDGHDIPSTRFSPVIRYQYTVAGQTYPGTRLARSDLQTGADAIKQIIDRYPEGSKVDVFRDPNDPTSAYLEVRRSGGALFLVIFGSFFLLMGLGALALAYFAG